MAKVKTKKKTAVSLIMFNIKITPKEHRALVRKAKKCTGGNVSELLRRSAAAYRPAKSA